MITRDTARRIADAHDALDRAQLAMKVLGADDNGDGDGDDDVVADPDPALTFLDAGGESAVLPLDCKVARRAAKATAAIQKRVLASANLRAEREMFEPLGGAL